MLIDTGFDVRIDSAGKDPDSHSPTLRRYHRHLWSKRLPCGTLFDLIDTSPRGYLRHRSDIGEFFLTSDTVVPSFIGWRALASITEQLPDADQEEFKSMRYTIGGMMVFPGNRIGGKMTINGARGYSRSIADRMDLTLECIRLHYVGEQSPLDTTLARYHDFFALFRDFPGYVDFFLLQDLVTEDYSSIRFFLPFDEFRTPSVPWDVGSYVDYRRRSIAFVRERNARIRAVNDEPAPEPSVQ